MIDSLRTRLEVAEARCQSAEAEVQSLLKQILEEVGLELVSARRSGAERWTLDVRLSTAPEQTQGDTSPSTALVETEAEARFVETENGLESENAPAPLPPVHDLVAADLESPEADDSPTEEDVPAASVAEEVHVASPDPVIGPLELDDDWSLAPMPDFPALPDPVSTMDVVEAAVPPGQAATEEPGGFELPDLPPLALVADEEDEVGAGAGMLTDEPSADTASVAVTESEPIDLSVPPASGPAPISAEESTDLATLLSNGQRELRVTHVQPRRKNPFKQASTDPRVRAERLARTLVSDIIAYAPAKHGAALRAGVEQIRSEFEAEIDAARTEYYAQVEASLSDRDAIFHKAVNELLGNGQEVL